MNLNDGKKMEEGVSIFYNISFGQMVGNVKKTYVLSVAL